MFPTNPNWSSPFNAAPWNNTAMYPGLNSPFANPLFAQTLTILVHQAVQQAIWQTLALHAQFQTNPTNWGVAPFGGATPFPFPGQWTASPQSAPSFQGQAFHPGYAPQGFSFTPPPPPGPWLNTTPQHHATPFQYQTPPAAPTHETVETASKRNGTR